MVRARRKYVTTACATRQEADKGQTPTPGSSPAPVLCDRLANRARLKLLEGSIVTVFEHWCDCTATLLRKAALHHQLSGGVPPVFERCVFQREKAL